MTVTRQTFDQVMIPCYVPQDMVLQRGSGCYLYDTEGKRYLDLSAGIAVNCLGHNHPEVVKTISEQAQRLIHVSNIFVNDKTLTLASELTALTGFDKVFFTNSGAEANEAALKLARRVAYDNFGPKKDEIISFAHSFHGRTLFSVSVGGQPKYSTGFGPIPGGITHLPFNDSAALEQTISDKTCAVILETIQGEGGILPIDPEFLVKVRHLCDQHHALLIFDEVQTGVGRTGYFYSFEQFKDLDGGKGVRPDIMSSAKGLAAGIPIGAILTTDEIAAHFKPGTHGSTFGGNPLACAVGSVVLHTVSQPEFLAHVRAMGDLIKTKLNELNAKYHCFAQLRGQGLLIGAELSSDYQGQSSTLQKLCTKHGLLVLVAGANVLRLTPPLIITPSEVNAAMELLEEALQEFTAQ
ncbi:MAG TPA: acetylornithine/succinyldiaminopimelate transaminase [Candidatus Anaerobiospirillum stercoravium]|nr:acetylornithine/succinyldiaminopimelate transaminase [Candidatus Anaerobiospirillum stercoravium]